MVRHFSDVQDECGDACMYIDRYDKQLALADLYEKLAVAENQIATGIALLDGEEVIQALKMTYACLGEQKR